MSRDLFDDGNAHLDGLQAVDDLRSMVHDLLQNCDSRTTPRICSRTSTPQGYLQVEQEIINMVMSDSETTIQTAIIHLESEYDDA